MNVLCGIAVNRLGVTPREFYWGFTPLEFHEALKDWENTNLNPLKGICSVIRMVAVTVYNSTPGRLKKDQVKDPKRMFQFAWEQNEKPKVQTVEEMKTFILGLSHHSGVRVSQKGKEVEFNG